MSFEVFRKHQKKGLAALALMAMIAFTLDLNLFRSQGGGPRQNPVVFEVAGKPIRQSDLEPIRLQRLRANYFMQNLRGFPNFFGDTSVEALRDAYVLDQEANKLGMPATPEVANAWLSEQFRTELTPELFDRIYRENFMEGPLACTDTQLLADIANQIRLYSLQLLPDSLASQSADRYLITPLDLYDAYRAEAEKVSAYAVPFPIDRYVSQVPEPKAAEVEEFYEKYKNTFADADLGLPGFKTPRRVKVEYVTLDANALEDGARTKLTDAELRAHYKENTQAFPEPRRELPLALFAGDKDATLTPRTIEPFQEVREEVVESLATQKAAEEVERRFAEIRDGAMAEFLERCDDITDRNLDAKERGAAEEPLPKPVGADGQSLMAAKAKELGIPFEATTLLTREEAANRAPIGGATTGSSGLDGGATFADHVFDEHSRLYESFELAEPRGLRFLGWKVEDVEPEVPTLDSIRDQVIAAWKHEEARKLAERDAKALAEEAKKGGGDLKAAAGDKLVLETLPVSKLSSSFAALTPNGLGTQRATDIPEIPGAGDVLRDALFALKPGEVVVEPNAARSQYYVLGLKSRAPADLKGLFSPIGSRFAIETRLVSEATYERVRERMINMRERAGATALAVPETGQGVASGE